MSAEARPVFVRALFGVSRNEKTGTYSQSVFDSLSLTSTNEDEFGRTVGMNVASVPALAAVRLFSSTFVALTRVKQ